MKKIWITWERHRRTRELVSSIGDVQLFELESKAHSWLRYPYLLTQTLWVLIKERPNLVLVQSPSLVLALFMVSFGKLFTSFVVNDAHNGGVQPFSDKRLCFSPLYRFLHRRADLTIVTNENLARIVSENGGTPFILQDKIPDFGDIGTVPLQGKFNAVFICTFGQDEPFVEVIRSSRYMNSSTYIYITGSYNKASPAILREASTNIIFTGFLPEPDYLKLLNSCDVIVDLTWAPDCLVCGAYEAVALEKPLVLTNDPTLRSYFRMGAVYTENTPRSIARAIQTVIAQKARLSRKIIELKNTLKPDWVAKLNSLKNILNTNHF